MSRQTQKLGVAGLCRWALPYAFRRWQSLTVVLATMLIRIGLDILKPWPIFFLFDYILNKKEMPPWVARIVEMLPGGPADAHLVAWSVAATVLFFLLSWIVGLANSYANINL